MAKTVKEFASLMKDKPKTVDIANIGLFMNCTNLQQINISAKDMMHMYDVHFKGCETLKKELAKIALQKK